MSRRISSSSSSLINRIAPFFLSRRVTHNHRPLTFSYPLSSSSALPEASSPSSSDDSVHLTDNFIKRMRELQASEGLGEEQMLRLGVEAGGCSGFQYVFDLDGKLNPDDRLFEKEGAKLVVDNVTYDFVKGATVDYEEELIRSAFVVSANPNSSSKCSCNSSFSVKQ